MQSQNAINTQPWTFLPILSQQPIGKKKWMHDMQQDAYTVGMLESKANLA